MQTPEDESQAQQSRLVVVSNRLPVRMIQQDHAWKARPGAGGLVTALTPVLRRQHGMWIGWSGVAHAPDTEEIDWDAVLEDAVADTGFQLGAISLEAEEVELYYEGFANGILWPLFHDRVGDCDFDRRYWRAYLRVARKFADAVLERAQPGDLVWVHDYHLFHVGELLRERRADQRLGFFLHIPFPPPDIFVRLPWWEELLGALLAYDRVGLQTQRDLRNLQLCLKRLVPDAMLTAEGGRIRVRSGGRTTIVEAHPIGIDGAAWAREAEADAVGERTRELEAGLRGAAMVLGVDRLDYTKGLLERLDAFELLLERRPELHRRVALVQLVVPSREGVARYQTLKSDLERKVGAINGLYGTPDWTPIRYLYRSVDRTELMALYRVARVCFVTSLKDGMNLVAKEFASCQVDEPGALVLSRFAGAAGQFKRGALLVNPHDISGTAQTLGRALALPREERERRMRLLRDNVFREDVHWWVERCLSGLRRPEDADLSTTAAK